MKKIFILFALFSISLFSQGFYPYPPTIWTKTGNNIYYTSGFVGIGTTTPAYTFTVQGNVFGTRLFVGNGTSGTPAILFDSESSLGFYRPSAANLVFVGGNFGFGGTSDGSKVRVIGGMKADTVLYTTLVNLSDITLKHSIRNVDWDLSKFSEVKPIYYKYKKEVYSGMEDSAATALSELEHTGFSAQEFNGKIAGTDSKQIDLMQINVALWLKVQELEERIKQLEQK